MEQINAFLNYTFNFGENVHISVKAILITAIVFIVTSRVLKLVNQIAIKNMSQGDSIKFKSVFSFVKYFIFLIVIFLALDNVGVNITAIFAASTALLIGVGLALQTLFQDIICGIFVLIDKTVHVGDIIEIDNKIVKVTDIGLRTTKGLSIENKVLIIPNHNYLTNTLYNWTQNGNTTREKISVGVAYGTDTALVKKLLIEAATNTVDILNKPEPTVYFKEFADSALNFDLVFTVNNSFYSNKPKSDLHFEIDKLFRKHNINIPFPQRDLHIITKTKIED